MLEKTTPKEENKLFWKQINKLDWRIILPIGVIIIIFFLQGKVQRGSLIYWVGIFCGVMGIVNLASMFMFRNPTENLRSMTVIGDYNPSLFKRNILAVFVFVVVLILGSLMISLFS